MSVGAVQKDSKATTITPAAPSAGDLKAAYVRFNERFKLFMKDMDAVYGKRSSEIGETRRQLKTFLTTDPARMRIAHVFWPHFSKHRAVIEARNPDVILKYDLAGFEKKFKLDPKRLWSTATENSKEAIWRAFEDMLDLLTEINAIRPIPIEDEDADPDAQAEKKSRNSALAPGASDRVPGSADARPWHESLDALVPVASLAPADPNAADEDDDDDNHAAATKGDKGAKGGPAAAGVAAWTGELMQSLKGIIGEDSGMDEEFDLLMNKLMNEPEDGKATPEDSAALTKIMYRFVERLAPTTTGDEEEFEGMDEKEKEAEVARRRMEESQIMEELKFHIGRLTEIEALSKTNNPFILESARQEELAEEERIKNPDSVQEFTITAHFNYKAASAWARVYEARGKVPSKKDGRILFPALKVVLAKMLAMFKENRSTEEIIKPVSEWVVAHRLQLLNKDERVFMEPDHPFLIDINSPGIWATLKPHQRANLWGLIGHPLQLATIFYHLNTPELRAISSIVNDLLAAGNIAYDTDPSELNAKRVITKAIKGGCTTRKIGVIRNLFKTMSTERDSKTLKALAALMRDVLPQAAKLRSGGFGHNEEDPNNDAASFGSDARAAENAAAAKAVKERSASFEASFNKLLAGIPTLVPIPDPKAPKPNSAAVQQCILEPEMVPHNPNPCKPTPVPTVNLALKAPSETVANTPATAPPPSTPAAPIIPPAGNNAASAPASATTPQPPSK
jgi:hypothetical protein